MHRRVHFSAVRIVRIGAATSSGEEGRTEMDSHADTCVVGRNALIVQDFDRPVDVVGYDASEGTKEEL